MTFSDTTRDQLRRRPCGLGDAPGPSLYIAGDATGTFVAAGGDVHIGDVHHVYLPAEPVWTAKPEAVPFQLPYPRNPYFTGRAQILQALREQLAAEGAAALGQAAAISGLGGVGKTQTAVEYAYRHRDDYPKGVFFVRAETRAELLSGFAELAEAVGMEGQRQEALAIAGRRWLEANDGWLLVVDNADDPALAQGFLPLGHRGHLLVTSRATGFAELGIRRPIQIRTLPPPEALELLVARAERGDPDGAERRAAGAVAEELGFLPLALEQAGAYVQETGTSFTDYLAAWNKHGLALLEKGEPVAGVGHDPVAITWLMSFEKVEAESKAAADVLRAAAFLAPEAIPDELLAECGDELGAAVAKALGDGDPLAVGELLAPLRRYSLVERDVEGRTWSVHRLVQAAVRTRVGEAAVAWRERVMMALRRTFPWPEFPVWGRCERLLGHVLTVIETVEDRRELAKLLNSTAWYVQQRGRYAEAEPLYLRTLAIVEQTSDEVEITKTLLDLAGLYVAQGRYADAESLYLRALEIQESALGEDHPEVTASLYYSLSGLYWHQGRYTEAEPLVVRALKLRESALGEDHRTVAHTLLSLAVLYKERGRYAEAEPLIVRAVAISEKALGKDHPGVAKALTNLAILASDQGRYAEAESVYLRALAISEKALGEDHPDVGPILNNLATLYRRQDRFAEAGPLYLRTLEVHESAFGEEHPRVAGTLNDLAVVYQCLGRNDKAEPLFRRALEIREKMLGEDHPHLASSLQGLAAIYAQQDRLAEAEPLLTRALELRRSAALGEEDADVSYSLFDLALLYKDQGRIAEAEPLLARALELREKLLGNDHPDTRLTRAAYQSLQTLKRLGFLGRLIVAFFRFVRRRLSGPALAQFQAAVRARYRS